MAKICSKFIVLAALLLSIVPGFWAEPAFDGPTFPYLLRSNRALPESATKINGGNRIGITKAKKRLFCDY